MKQNEDTSKKVNEKAEQGDQEEKEKVRKMVEATEGDKAGADCIMKRVAAWYEKVRGYA